MTLPSGTRLGPYEVTSPLGAGGMGEVYRARDTRLDRSVAIKVLGPDVAGDASSRSRFEREARAIAALSHPHICTLYDVGEHEGTAYLVMELLDGQTLAARLEKGPLPLDQALRIAGEIADALDKAHRQGIVHRDLKPANVMLTKGGAGSAGSPHAKLLDFGLAKLKPTVTPVTLSGAEGGASTTIDTARGTILGTVQYMAPEQVEGREADARSDIWAFGAVLYEMVTGVRPFTGDTPASVIGAILKDTPAPLSSRQPVTPPLLDSAVSQCLHKDPDGRWQSAADLRRVLALAAAGPASIGSSSRGVADTTPLAARGRWLPWAVAAAAVAALGAVLPAWREHRSEPAPAPLQLSLLAPDGTQFTSPPASVVAPQIALSPDGTQLAFIAQGAGARPSLWVRSLREASARSLRGTDDATYPFWSPDGRAIAFFAHGKLQIVELAGGPPRTVTDAGLDSRGGTWAPDGTILFAAANGVLTRVSASGGPTATATALDESRRETSHRFPSFLPDGRHFIFATRTRNTTEDSLTVSVASLDDPMSKPLVARTAWGARFANGHLLFLRSGTLLAQPFDVTRLETTGDAFTLAENVGATTTGYAAFSVSNNGTVAHASAIGLPGQLRWFSRTGATLGEVSTPAEYLDFALSPDERTLAMSRVDDLGSASADIWLLDLARGVPTRLVGHRMNDASVLWSPRGDAIAFRSNRDGYTQLYERRVSDAETERRILDTEVSLLPGDWSRDGKWIVFTETTSFTGFDIRVWPVDGSAQPQIEVDTALNAIHGKLSPDGRWLAYATDESGELQVWVQRFPGAREKRQVSGRGGDEPRWRADGRELFYLAPDGFMMSVDVAAGDSLSFSSPKPLFQVRVPIFGSPYREHYAVTADGQRFLVNTRVEQAPPALNLILNWPALLLR